MDKRLNPVAFAFAATFAAAAAEADTPRKFSGTAYSGGVVTDHPFFDRVAFDLATTKLETPAPALFGHYEPVGVIRKAELGTSIEIAGDLFANLDDNAKKIATFADQGMPWQMSVGIWPGRIEQVKAGAKVQLNGQSFEGPLTVFRDNRVREVSFVALGADHKTDANVFSIGGARRPTQEDNEMDQQEHERIVAELNTKYATDTKALTDKVAELEARFAAQQKATRLAAVKALFEARDGAGKFKDEQAAPYLGMTDEQFAAVAEVFKASKPALDPSLTREHATQGSGEAPKTVDAIRAAARTHIAEQAKVGVEVSIADAVTYVTRQAA